MELFINSNISSINAQRQLLSVGESLSVASERLSSGKRINSAADDAAGLQISTRLTSQIDGLDQAIRNANDGISLVQTAEGGLAEITNHLQRMRQLTLQAQNGIYTALDVAGIQSEVDELIDEIRSISGRTSFGGRQLLDAALDTEFQVGADAQQTIQLDFTKEGIINGAPADVDRFGPDGLGVTGLKVATNNVINAPDAFGGVEGVEDANLLILSTGASFSPGEYTAAVSSDGRVFSEFSFTILPTDTAFERSQKFVSGINSNVRPALLPAARLNPDSSVTQLVDLETLTNTANPNPVSINPYTNLFPVASLTAIEALDNAIADVDTARAELGAKQNRLEATVRNLSNEIVNLSASRSRIEDSDVAQETATLTRNQIIQQAGLTILSQSNQRPQIALQLLNSE